MKKKYIVAFLIFFIGMVVFSKAWAYTIANKNGYVDTYVQPCFKNSEGHKYCSGQAGTYFYDDVTKKFWMYLTRVNSSYVIIDTKYLEYNPVSKTVNWNSKRTPSVMLSNYEAVNRAIAGQYNKAVEGECYLISVSQPAKTVAQYQAECKKQAEAIKLAKQKTDEAKIKEIENNKKKHQEALTSAQQAGTLTSCKKMYWKYSFSPKYLYTETNPQPYKDVEGTEQSYCSLKDGSTAMLQFEDHKDSQSGAIYRAPKLMDFTGKTKYYPWD